MSMLNMLTLISLGNIEEFKRVITLDTLGANQYRILLYAINYTDNPCFLSHVFSLLKTRREQEDFANSTDCLMLLSTLTHSTTGNALEKNKILLEMGANPNVHNSIDNVLDYRGKEWITLFLKHGALSSGPSRHPRSLFHQTVMDNIDYYNHVLIIQALVSIRDIPRIGRQSPVFVIPKEIIREIFKFLI